MKKISTHIAVFSLLMLLQFQVSAQFITILQPHFNGHETSLQRLDSTNGAWSGNPDQYADAVPDSTYPVVDFMAWTFASCPGVTRFLLGFKQLTDPTVIHADDTIISAILCLYGVPSSPTGDFGNSTYSGSPYNSYGADSGYLYMLASPFYTTTCWNTQPDILHTDSVCIQPSTEHWGGNDTLDVTNMINYLRYHGNNGFEFRMATEQHYREHLFGSSRYPDSTLHPMLILSMVSKETSSLSVSANSGFDTRISLYPNPASNLLNIQLNVEGAGEVKVEALNLLGQVLIAQTQETASGYNKIAIPVEQLPAGCYMARVSGAGFSKVFKFDKQ